MTFDLYRPVRLLSDDYRTEGVMSGAIGVVIEDYGDAYEVAFSREDGTTIAWFAVRPDEIAPVLEDTQSRVSGGRPSDGGETEDRGRVSKIG
jgi:hypothetical protein